MRTNRSGPLPPLPPAPPRPELKKITNLVNKALTSTSLKEKNDLLQEMRVIWIPQNEELEAITASNQAKQREYDGFKQKMEQYQKDCETLRVNTSFYYRAQNVRDRRNESAITRIINGTEAEISKISTLSSPNKLQKVNELSSNPDKHLFTLMDLNLSRLEELAYSYKKRLLIVEQSQESTDVILKEFGSVYGLLDKEKELAEENTKLRNDEKAFIHDAFTRRRKFASMSPNVARTMATVFTSEIENQEFTLENYEAANFEVNKAGNGEIDFDAVCRDPGFSTDPNHYDESEFTANDETTEKLLQTEDPKERLRNLRELIDQLESNNSRLVAEISTARQKKRKGSEQATTRLEKLFDENDQLFARIAREQDILDKRTSESENIAKDVLTSIKHRSGYKQHFVDIFAQYRDLSKAQAEISEQLYKDKAILGSLLYVASSFGEQLLDGINNELKTPLAELLSSQIVSVAKVLEDTTPPPPPPQVEAPKEEPQEEISILSIVKGNKKPKRKGHKENKLTNSVSSTSLINDPVQEAAQQPKPTQVRKGLMFNPTQAELFNAVSLALDLGGYVIGHDERYHQAANKTLMKVLNSFSTGTRNNLSSFEKEFHENFLKIRICANQLLVKQKENIAIQTEAAPRTDEETQAGETPGIKSSASRKKL